MVNRGEIVAALTEIFATDTVSGWQARLTPAGVPCTPVLTVDQVVREEQVRARDMIVEVEHPDAGTLRLAGVPIKFSEAAGGVRTPPPRLGQHSRAILEDLGYAAADVRGLIEAGVVGVQ
jgi:crotonobetainyl-CoA:carnitine CoA-transferase CaiB-like acyl-CoA transferase